MFWPSHWAYVFHITLGQGPVLEILSYLTGLTLYFKIKSKRIEKQALTLEPVHFVSLADSFIV